MPRLIDWGVRYDLIREAVVRIAARRGAEAVTIDSVATELKLHPSTLRRALSSPDVLRAMGVAWIVRRRGARLYLRGRGTHEYGSVEHLSWALQMYLPLDEDDLEHERAWKELTTAGMDEQSARHRQNWDEALDKLIDQVLGMLGTEPTSRPQLSVQLRALIDGLISALCRSDITSDQAIECVEATLRQLPLVPELRPSEPEPRIKPVVGGSPR
ncbi:MAG: hypothetical protein JWR90_871 [Marmoricola sp.]|jgi:AcrR family transcriptional regulator|nr:hypothetical protein [Marmoricola sp.]